MEQNNISSLLTPGQRAYLWGSSDIDSGSANERATRARIRNRLTQGIWDLAILQENLEARDVEQAFDSVDFNDIAPAMALMLDGTTRVSEYEHPSSDEQSSDDDIKNMFEQFYTNALRGMYINRGIVVERITVDIDIELGSNFDEVANDDLSELPKEQLAQLLGAGEINSDEFIEALETNKNNSSIEADGDDPN